MNFAAFIIVLKQEKRILKLQTPQLQSYNHQEEPRYPQSMNTNQLSLFGLEALSNFHQTFKSRSSQFCISNAVCGLPNLHDKSQNSSYHSPLQARMKQTKMWVEELLAALALKPAKISELFDQLVYGKAFSCMRGGKKQEAILYLNEDVPEMLVATSGKEREKEVYLNLRETRAIPSSPQHELQFKLTENQYVVLKNESEELIVLFQGATVGQKTLQRTLRDAFLQFLRFYLLQLAKSPFELESLLLYTFISVDRNQNMTLEAAEIRTLLGKMRMRENEQFWGMVRHVRREEELGEAEITFTEFEEIMKLLQCRVELKELFQRLALRKLKSFKLYMEKLLPMRNFHEFLRNEQMEEGEALTAAMDYFAKEERISFYDFSRFMMSRYAQIYDDSLQTHQEDLSQPLTSYYCFSSHNTYLTGNQLTSDSKAERYREDLENGYRCLQIDVHDGPEGPIVKHGYTMTSAISFAEVIQTVARFSNENPGHTPIILSLENHAGERQQLEMSRVLLEYFGGKILTIHPCINDKHFPTLQATMGKVIIKNSGSFLQYQLVTEMNSSAISAITTLDNSGSESEEEGETPSMLIQTVLPPDVEEHMRQFSDLQRGLQNQKRQFLKSQQVFRKFIGRRSSNLVIGEIKKKMHPEMLKLTSILGKGSLKKPCIWESVSLSEATIQNYFLTNHAFLKNWTESHWIRAYPSGSRVDSSNYNPIPALELGIQIPALNSQSNDHFVAALRLFFRKGSERCTGYRLKTSNQGQGLKEIKIRPVSCSMISSLVEPQVIPDVQVKMSLLGSAYDMLLNQSYAKMEAFTERIRGNAYNPVFSQGRIMQLRIAKPEMAFILVEIQHCGMGVIAVEGLKRGYRHMALLGNGLRERKGKIYFKID